MSVTESEKECPLCMETLDWDDLEFYPCSCGYQICRFCWHRLRTDENGLCPACRQAFPDIPVSFNPEISAEELKKQKRRNKEKRSKDQVFRPQDLATLRVVQKNLVFVIGLSSRLTQEDLKKEFAHFGKIIKFVHNKSTAYITYSKPEEAIRAIRTLNASTAAQQDPPTTFQFPAPLTNGTSNATTQNGTIVNNVASMNNNSFFMNAMSMPTPTNRLKASLGTTKYCNHFLRSQQCPKVGECMYLHEIADAEASFTKEQMQAGKHVEYEKKLMDSYVAASNLQPQPQQASQIRHLSSSQLHNHQPQSPQQQSHQRHLATSPSSTPQLQLQSSPQAHLQQHKLQQQLLQQRHQNQLLPQFQLNQQPRQQPEPSPQQMEQQQQQLQLEQQQQLQLEQQQQQQQLQLQQQQQQQQHQQQLATVADSDSDDDGLDFDPISVSTSGLRDLLDQQVQQAKQLQMQNYIQQMSSNQSLASVLFQQNNRVNQTAPTTGRLLMDAASLNGHPSALAPLAGLNSTSNQPEQVAWPNLGTWTNFLHRSGYGFENGR